MKLIEKIKDIIFKIKDYNKSAYYFNKQFTQKILYNKPIYRVDILHAVKYNYCGLRCDGICASISRMCRFCLNKNSSLRGMGCIEAKKLFFKLSRSNAYDFHLNEDDDGYWWVPGDWKGGRIQFLDWLIEEYKDDKEDLRYLII